MPRARPSDALAALSIRRPLESEVAQITAVRVATWRNTYSQILPEDFLAAMGESDHIHQQEAGIRSRLDTLLVAVEGCRVRGFVDSARSRDPGLGYEGEINALYVEPAAQARGIGTALTRAAAAGLIEQGMRSAHVWVLSENPYRRFYESLGGVLLTERTIQIGPVAVSETAYGWRDLSRLARG